MNAQLEAKIEKSKEVLRLARDMSLEYYGKPLVLTYSGGKDSDVMLDLAINALLPNEFEVINSHTSVDAPETVYHIRKVFDGVRGGARSVLWLSREIKRASKSPCGTSFPKRRCRRQG